MLVLPPTRRTWRLQRQGSGRDKIVLTARLFFSFSIHNFARAKPRMESPAGRYTPPVPQPVARRCDLARPEDGLGQELKTGGISVPSPFVRGLKCRLCGTLYPITANNFCTEDFGPL